MEAADLKRLRGLSVVSAPGSTKDSNEPALAPLFALKMLDSLPDLVCYVEPDLRYRFVNNAYRAWFGVEPSEVMGRHVSEFLGEESYRKARPHLERALAGEPASYTELQPYRHGQPRRVEARLIPDMTDDGEVRGLFAVVRDVSHRELIYQQILSVLDGMDASFLALDQDGRINFMNAAAERFLTAAGFGRDMDREAMLGRRPWEVNPESRGGVMHQAFERVRASKQPESFEFKPPLRPDRILDLRVFPTPSGAVGFSGIDITERRRAEDELLRKEERLRLALDAARMMAFDHNARTGETYFSDNVREILGERPAAGYASRFHPQDQDLLMSAQERVLETGAPSDLTIRFTSAIEGEWQWMNLQATRALDGEGRPVRLIGVMRDVTRAHMAEELLRSGNVDLQARVESESAERLKAVLDRERFWTLSTDLYAVVTLEKSGGRLRRINAPAWKALLGYDSDQLLGVPLRTFIHPDDLAHTLAEVAKLFEDVPLVEFEYRFRHAEGGWRWMSWKVISDGEFSYAAGRDVTEDKAREEQERRTQKLEALGQLTGGVAHDFNNILTVIMGALDLVEKRPDDVARRQSLISSALVAAKKGEMLNKQLLGFARRQAAHREFVVPAVSLEEMAPLIHGALGDSIPLEIAADGETRGVMTDPAQFEVAVLNLVVNARDAMPDGGALRIAVRAASADEVRRFSLADGDYLAVDVKDSGSGMSSDVLAHVFEPFFTTKEIGKGSGLGLAQVYGFARQCGGTADIQTAPGLGTTVTLYLPASQPPPAAAAPEPAPIAGAVSPKRILLVEDDVLVGAVTESMLLDMGHQVTRAEEAAGARAALERAEFDLLLTDVRMPGGTNGVQLAREATRSRPDLKVLLCSGWTDDQLDKEGLGGAWPLLAKPYDEYELERALRDVLASP